MICLDSKYLTMVLSLSVNSNSQYGVLGKYYFQQLIMFRVEIYEEERGSTILSSRTGSLSETVNSGTSSR